MPYPEAVRSPIVFVLILGLLVAAPGFAALDRVLMISVDTLRFHVRNIYDKLHVHSKSEAVLKALRSGILR